MAKFLIVTEGITKAQSDSLTDFLKNSNSFGYWHWIEDLWLVTANSEESAKSLYLKVMANVPSLTAATMLIVGFDPLTHWGRLNKDAWPWMHTNFGLAK